MTLDEISTDVGAFTGDIVTVSGNFAGTVDERAFLLLGESSENKVVVLSVDPLDVEANQGDQVQVTGTVYELTEHEYLNDFDATLRDEVTRLDVDAVIVADTVTEG